ncbi:MFS transporter [Paenibacillus sp. CECT 9249]|uniref:MFS transporter n=1 Tax=unclassified Paenibacillus TaxID=185978 RepID=UPI001C10DA4D|nr:MFS transporter [Paenibacillus sp. CECT 9249]MBU5441040.1 MFS transporter [Paenibacillus sp. MSJ-34]CAH0117970.1 putative glycolipid permease LtaA [Paenibacillus sp. CECT 9249]
MKSIRNLGIGREIWLLSFVLFLVEFARGATLVSFVPIYGKEILIINATMIGAAITAHYLTDTGLKIVIGYLLDRFSIRFIVHSGLLISLIGMFMFQYGSRPGLFILASALYGVGMSPIWIVCLSKVSPERRATQMGYLYTIWLIGMGLGPVVCNLLIDASPKLTYWILVLLTLGAWFLSMFISNERQSSIDTIPLRTQLRMLGERLRMMRPLLPGMILQTTGASMIVPILPSFAQGSLALTSGQYSLLLLLGGACAVVGLIPMGKLADQFGRKWFLVIGFAIFAFALYSLSMLPSLRLTFIWAIVLGLSYSAVLPAWNALLASYIPPSQKGLGWGLFSTVEGIGVMIGPVLGGFLSDMYNEQTVVMISAVLFGLIALFYILYPIRSSKGEAL